MKSDLRVFAAEEARLILLLFIFGFAAALVYDLFRILRTFLGCGLAANEKYTSLELPLIGKAGRGGKTALAKNVSRVMLFVFDLLYMTLFAVFTVIFFYSYADGVVRWYTLLSLALGFFVYMKTVGTVTKNAIGAIIFALSTLCRYIWYFGVKPFILLRKIYTVCALPNVTV